jgi:F420-dependent methylenetetrahydromethanopterin dehydrogenase
MAMSTTRHQSLNSLVIHEMASAPYSNRYAAIAIPALVLVERRANLAFQHCVLISRLQRLLLIVKGAACQTGKLQQAFERMQRPQSYYDLRFFCCATRFFS